MKIKQFLFFSLLWFAQNQSFAQEKLSLKDAIATALLNNYDIKLVNNQVAIAQNNVNLGNAGMLPNLLGNFRTGGGVQDAVQTQASGTKRVINDARNTNLAYGVGLDWTIFDGFRMFANLDRLKALEQQGKVNAKAQILTTISAVVTAYYNLARQQELVKATDSALSISKLRVTIADNKLKIGKGSKLDVLSAKVDYNTDTSFYLQQKNLLANFGVTLNQLLARDINTPFTVNSEIDIDKNLNYNNLVSLSAQLNPSLQSALLDKKIAELNLKTVKANRYPQISVNSGYEILRSATPTGFNTQFRANGLSYGLTASVNIFNGFLQKQNERNAKIAINSTELNLNRTKEAIVAQLTSAYQNYSTFLDLIKLEAKNLENADQNLDITLEKYRLGSISPLELREAQRNSINAKNRFLDVQYQAKLAEIELKEISSTLNIQ
jgi:outer membrane protein TolC